MQQTIQLDTTTVTIDKLPLGKYAELLKALRKLPQQFAGMEKLTNTELVDKLPGLIADNIPEVVNMLHIATNLPEDVLNELGLHEVVRLVMGVIEANQYKEIYDLAKKALARPTTPTPTDGFTEQSTP